MQKIVGVYNRNGVVAKKDIASWCFVRDIKENEITFISDAKFRKGDKISIQLSRSSSNIKESFFITAVVKKKPIQIPGSGSLNYAWVC